MNHSVVVHLDLDTLVLKPMDALFDLMLGLSRNTSQVGIMWNDQPLPTPIDAFFTHDYNLVHPRRKHKPIQGGLLVVRPSLHTYNQFVDILRKGEFQEGHGWGGTVGPFYGSMTIQGLLPYFFEALRLGNAVELNRCIHNQMSDNPRTKDAKPGEEDQGKCRTGQSKCEDCRESEVDDIVSVHYTVCQKPW